MRQPLVVLAFGGWIDAGTSGTGAVRYLINELAAQKIAELDSEEFYSFTDTRPLTAMAGPGQRTLHWPDGEFYAATAPGGADRDLLLFVAPEPNLKWRTYARSLLDVFQQVGSTELLCVGSIFGAVHHRADVPLTGWATDTGLRETLIRHNISFTNYEGPTGFVTALLAEAQTRALPAGAIFGFAPSYIQGVPNPRVSYAVLRAVARVADIPLPLADLERAGRALLRQVDSLLAGQPELREQVDRMLRLASAIEEEEVSEEEAESSPASQDPLPSPQAFVKELEDYLKQLRGEQGEGGQPPRSSDQP